MGITGVGQLLYHPLHNYKRQMKIPNRKLFLFRFVTNCGITIKSFSLNSEVDPMKYLMTCLIVAVLAGCDQTSDTTGKSDNDGTDTQAQTAPDAVKDPNGRVFEYGIYNAQRKGRVRDDISANTGKVINKPVLEIAEQTDRIPLVKGTYFAYRYRLMGFPKEEAKKPAIELRKVLVHPEMALPDGSTATGSDRVFKGRASVGQVIGFDGYAFNEDYELVEGDWTFQIWYRDHMLVEQTFTTYWPEEGAGADKAPAEPAAEN
jgi:hypothetical protein